MQESFVKYLAGLIDADGSIQFLYRPLKEGWRLQIHLALSAAESTDREGKLIKSLPEQTGLGTVTREIPANPNWSPRNVWHVCARSDCEKLIPRLAKHMVLKDGLFTWCLQKLRETKNVVLNEEDVESLKKELKSRREFPENLKKRSHPTWAWAAGFLDGGGYYSLRRGRYTRCGAVCHENDRVTLDLLHKAFGGSIRKERNVLRWHRNLGPRDASFASKFLGKMVQHSRLKKHKIEMILHANKQRLSRATPAGEATV